MNRKCNHCKTTLNKSRTDDLSDILLFDGKCYHTKCFLESKVIKKKCKYCGKDIIVPDQINDCVFYDDRYFHIDCFKQQCQLKNTKKWNAALIHIDEYKSVAFQQLNEILKEKHFDDKTLEQYKLDATKYVKNWFDEADVNEFVREFYGIQVVPYARLAQVYKGTFKQGMIPIPACDLLEMWKKKKTFLTKVYQKNLSENKTFSPENRIYYDLAILINKYNSFLKWKEEQSILENKPNEIVQTPNLTQFVTASPQNNNTDEDKDIKDLVEDIFGDGD